MRKNSYILFLFVALLSFVACDKEQAEAPSSMMEVSIRASQSAATRTSMGEVENGKQVINWSEGDQVCVWAKPTAATDSDPYTLNGKTFTLATYNPSYNDADFKANIPAMEEGEYNYYAIYPTPQGEPNGTSVTYHLPAQQNGEYNPSLDVMYASEIGNALIDRGSSLTNIPINWEEPKLEFNHLFHLLRIHIPVGKNNLHFPIKRLEITFQQGVVGDVAVDATTGELSWNEDSLEKSITIELDNNNLIDANSGYVWIHVLPRELSGEVTFVAYNEAGVISKPIKKDINKSLSAQSITPIALTIPASPLEPLTYVQIKETANNLGENWNTMTFSGRSYVVPFSAGSTSQELTITPNDNNSYVVAINAAPSTLANQPLAMVYDTPNTYFDCPITLGSSLAEGVYNRIDHQVPYLLEEDFSRIEKEEESYGNNDYSQEEQDHPGVSLLQLAGWNASRFWAKSGTMRLNTRFQSVKASSLGFQTKIFGRLDSTPLTKLKNGKTVKVNVSFDAGKYVHKSSTSSNKPTKVSLVIATNANLNNPINGMIEGSYLGTEIKTGTNWITGKPYQYEVPAVKEYSREESRDQVVKGDEIEITNDVGENAFGTKFPPIPTKLNVSGVTNSIRLCFYPVSVQNESGIGNCESNVYIDNIKVSIAN